MANSVVIPQDIINTIIETVDGSRSVLNNCALVSSSFLLPSRKRIFSRLYLSSNQGCQRLQQFLVENPLIIPSVTGITLGYDYGSLHCSLDFRSIGTSLIALLQLPFCSLNLLSIDMLETLKWNDFSSVLKDVLSTIIHSSTLKTLNLRNINVPIMLLQGTHLMELRLGSLILDGEHSRLLKMPVSEGVATTKIDQDVWAIHLGWQVHGTSYSASAYLSLIWDITGPAESVFLPFMCRLRVLEINCVPRSANISDLQILSFLIRSLHLSLTSPPTLEHLKLRITFERSRYFFNHDAFYDDLRDADFWRHLDSIVTHPSGSRLQRVDIDIKYYLRDDDAVGEPDPSQVEGPVLDALPLLREKGILSCSSKPLEADD